MNFFEVKKAKKSMESLDRLSELPDSLIFSIFWFMPMIDVVATTFLSKRFRNLWTTAPYLNFTGYGKGYVQFINRSLIFWRGTKILKMRIELVYKFGDSLPRDIDLWVRFAKDFGVEELYLHPTEANVEQIYTVPQYIFSSCPSLKVLSLQGCRHPIPINIVRWNQLKSLTIHTHEGPSFDGMNHVMRGSPQLEVLDLTFCESHAHLSIESNSLKKLAIEKYLRYGQEASPVDTELIIWTPNLETFKISNVPYRYCYLENVSSLTNVSIMFEDRRNVFTGDKILDKPLIQIFSAIQHVENVTLSDWCIKVLWTLKKKRLVPTLNNVNFLKFKSNFLDHESLAGVFEIFPKVKMLVVEDGYLVSTEPLSCDVDLQPNLPNLMRVEVIWAERGYSIFPFIQILLKSASRLEKLVFRVDRAVQPRESSKPLLLASQKLLRMQRSSPAAKLLFCERA